MKYLRVGGSIIPCNKPMYIKYNDDIHYLCVDDGVEQLTYRIPPQEEGVVYRDTKTLVEGEDYSDRGMDMIQEFLEEAGSIVLQVNMMEVAMYVSSKFKQ